MELTLIDWAIMLPLGALISLLGTLAGLGGGVLMVPCLVLLFGVPLKTAISSIAFCLLPATLFSTVLNAKRRQIDYFVGVSLEIPTIVGAVLGAALVALVPLKPLATLFAVLVAFMGWKVLKKSDANAKSGILDLLNQIPPHIERNKEDYAYRAGLPAVGFFGFVSGVMAGLFGIGGGIIKTPLMLKVFHMPARKATATALFMIVFTSATASFSHWQAGRLSWELALPLSGAFVLGAFIGNQVVGTISNRSIEKTLGIMMWAASIAIVVHSWILKS